MVCENYLRQIWLDYECNCLPVQTSTASPEDTHTCSKTANVGPFPQKNHLQISVAGFSAMVGLQIILLAIVITGWIWTCWVVKKRHTSSSTCR